MPIGRVYVYYSYVFYSYKLRDIIHLNIITKKGFKIKNINMGNKT